MVHKAGAIDAAYYEQTQRKDGIGALDRIQGQRAGASDATPGGRKQRKDGAEALDGNSVPRVRVRDGATDAMASGRKKRERTGRTHQIETGQKQSLDRADAIDIN